MPDLGSSSVGGGIIDDSDRYTCLIGFFESNAPLHSIRTPEKCSTKYATSIGGSNLYPLHLRLHQSIIQDPMEDNDLSGWRALMLFWLDVENRSERWAKVLSRKSLALVLNGLTHDLSGSASVSY